MTDRWDELVVGADGFLGSALLRQAQQEGRAALGTSRRPQTPPARHLHLDLADPALPELPPAATVHLCAAVAGFAPCATDPAGTRAVNVEGLFRVARRAHEAGAFLVLPSTSAVFPGTSSDLPRENSPTSPTTEYARQKADLEARLRDLDRGEGRVAILRLTKVLAPSQPVICRILAALATGEPVEAFTDLLMAPVSLTRAAEALLRLGRERQGGVYHLSGAETCSYAALAQALALRLGRDPGLVKGVRAPEAAQPAFMPLHPGLDMAASGAILGPAQPLSALVADLLATPQGIP